MPNISHPELLVLTIAALMVVLFLFLNRKAFSGPNRLAPCTKERLA